jgi:hypothetical protein
MLNCEEPQDKILNRYNNRRQTGGSKMEPEVHIIEKYFQVVLGCLTMTNVKCDSQKEIDVLAIDPIMLKRYHIEVNAWTTRYDKVQEDWLEDEFHKKKFDYSTVKQKIREVFGNVAYNKVLVVWKVKNQQVIDTAKEKFHIEIRLMGDILKELQEAVSRGEIKGSRDDVLRIMELVSLVKQEDSQRHLASYA